MPLTPLTWRDQFTVNTTTANSQFDPEITQLANGNILVSWTTNDVGGLGSPNGNEVFGQIFDPLGNKIGAEIRLNNASTGDDEQNSQVAALPGGGFVVVYHDVDNPFNGGASNIRLEEYDANGVAVSDDALVVNDSTLPNDPDYQNPRVAVSSATSVLVVYEEVIAGVPGIRGKLYDTTTNTYGAQISLIAFAGGDTNPDVTVLTNGNYVITANVGGADTSIGYRIVNSTGGNVLGATRVTGSDTNTDNDREATVTALTGGGFVIVWTNTDLNDTDIEGRVYNAAGTETGTFSAGDTGATNLNNEPVVAGLADGSFVVVFDNDELDRLDVTHFNATGGNLGTFTIAATAATSPVVTDLGDGRFSVAWSDSAGEIAMEILDTRDNPNNPGVYTPDQWVVGTVGDDVFTPAANAEITHGWDGNDTITERGGTREYYGDDGNDTIIVVSQINSDRHDGGAGINDVINWAGTGEVGATYDLALGTATNAAATQTEQMLNFENLIGTANRDIIIGTDGVNSLNGGGGDDTIEGGVGADILNGDGNGLFGDTASYRQSATGVTVNLAIVTQVGGGDAAGDTLTNFENAMGSAQVDTLTGNGGNNVLMGLGGGDTLNGGGGLGDTADYADSDASVSVGLNVGGTAGGGHATGDTLAGIENLTGSAFGDTLIGSTGINTLRGGGGADNINASNNNDTLFGEAGDDLLAGGVGADLIDGGANDAGGDTATYSNHTGLTGMTINLATGVAIGNGHGAGDTLVNIENAVGSAQNDTITGDGNANVLTAGNGLDTLNGGAGADTLNGQNGDDIFVGGAGADANNGGGGLHDKVDYSLSALGVWVDLRPGGIGIAILGDSFGDTWTGIEDVTGSASSDNMFGSTAANILLGGLSDDTLYGSAGADTMNGGGGTSDTANYSQSSGAVSIDLLAFTASGGHAAGDTIINIENLVGSDFGDTLSGNNLVNFIFGGNGNDTINGNGNGDNLNGGAGDDTLNGGSGADTFTFQAAWEDDTINGWQNGADKIQAVGAGALTHADFTETQDGFDTLLTLTADPTKTIRLTNILATTIDAGDFV